MAFQYGEPAEMRHDRRDVLCSSTSTTETLIATGTQSGTIVLWEYTEGAEIMKLSGGHKGNVNAVAFNADSTIIASGGEDGNLLLWDLGSAHDGTAGDGEAVKFRKLEGHGSPILCMAFSTDSGLLATGAKDSDIMIWGSLGRPVCHRLRGHNNWVTALCFSKDDRLLVTAGFDHAVCIWNVSNFNIIRTIRHHQVPVTSVAMAAEGSVIASGDEEGTIYLMRVSDGACLRVLRGHIERVSGLRFVESFGLLFSCGVDSSIKVWTLRGSCLRSFKAHDGSCLSLDVSHDNDTVISTGDDFHAKAWPFVWSDQDAEEFFDYDDQ